MNASQEPATGRVGQPEEGSWEAELRETTETVQFSYLHPLAWRRDAWTRLLQGHGNQVGVAACQLHGLRSPTQGQRPFTEFEGQTLRAQRDGAVIPRKIFRTRAYPAGSPTTGAPSRAVAEPAAGTLTVLFNEDELPVGVLLRSHPGRALSLPVFLQDVAEQMPLLDRVIERDVGVG